MDESNATSAELPMSMSDSSSYSPLRRFLNTETSGAGLLLAAVVAAMAWASLGPESYEKIWETPIRFALGEWTGDLPLRGIVNEGLMTIFFLVVGLEARRELDLGELRDHRRLVLPIVVGIAGMAIPVAIYLGVTSLFGAPEATHGWGAAMSTDTALSLGALTLLGGTMPASTRTFLLTALVVDDIGALIAIATGYSGQIRPVPLLLAGVALTGIVLSRKASYLQRQLAYVVLGVTMWALLVAARVDPVIAGLAIGLVTSAHTPSRNDLQEATSMVRRFREQPNAASARTAQIQLAASISANTQLQYAFHPMTSKFIVPMFALGNAGVTLSGASIAHAARSPITISIVLAYLIGKPTAALIGSRATERLTRRSVRPQVGYGAVLGGGVVAGVGLTVSLLIAALAFEGAALADAKLGIILTIVTALSSSWLTFRVINLLPEPVRLRAMHGDAQQVEDLTDPVDEAVDHILGRNDAVVTVIEYGDLECPWTAMSSPSADALLARNPDIRYVWRHLPLTDIHPYAEVAAQATEAAGAQGQFWQMHKLLLEHQEALDTPSLVRHAVSLGLDVERFRADLASRRHAMRVARDIESADASGIAGTPTFVINGRRHEDVAELDVLSAAIASARDRAHAAALVRRGRQQQLPRRHPEVTGIEEVAADVD